MRSVGMPRDAAYDTEIPDARCVWSAAPRRALACLDSLMRERHHDDTREAGPAGEVEAQTGPRSEQAGCVPPELGEGPGRCEFLVPLRLPVVARTCGHRVSLGQLSPTFLSR